MEKEVSSASILGVVLISLAVIVGMSFGVFAITKSSSNDGVSQFQDTANTVSESWLQDFNEKTVYGAKVVELINKGKDKNIAVFVGTQSLNSGGNLYAEAPILQYDEAVFINYGCLFDYSDAYYSVKTGSVSYQGDSSLFKEENNRLITTRNFKFKENSGLLDRYINVEAVSMSGTSEYIGAVSKFFSRLIYSKDGTIVGVLCEQGSKVSDLDVPPGSIIPDPDPVVPPGWGDIVGDLDGEGVESDGDFNFVVGGGNGSGVVGNGGSGESDDLFKEVENYDDIWVFADAEKTILTGVNTSLVDSQWGTKHTGVDLAMPSTVKELRPSNGNLFATGETNLNGINSLTLSPNLSQWLVEWADSDLDYVIRVPENVVNVSVRFSRYMESDPAAFVPNLYTPYHTKSGFGYAWGTYGFATEAGVKIKYYDCGCEACLTAKNGENKFYWIWKELDNEKLIVGYSGELPAIIEVPNGCTGITMNGKADFTGQVDFQSISASGFVVPSSVKNVAIDFTGADIDDISIPSGTNFCGNFTDANIYQMTDPGVNGVLVSCYEPSNVILLTIADGVHTIGSYSLFGGTFDCIDIPSSVTTIEPFNGCTALSVYAPKHLESAVRQMVTNSGCSMEFFDCGCADCASSIDWIWKGTSIVGYNGSIPDGIDLVIPNGCTAISVDGTTEWSGMVDFTGINVKSFTIPNSVKTIAIKLDDSRIDGKLTVPTRANFRANLYNAYVFEMNDPGSRGKLRTYYEGGTVMNLTINSGVKTITDWALGGGTFDNVYFPSTVTSFEGYNYFTALYVYAPSHLSSTLQNLAEGAYFDFY